MSVVARVEEGETIGIIAAKYKTTVEDIIVLNKVSSLFNCTVQSCFVQYINALYSNCTDMFDQLRTRIGRKNETDQELLQT